MTEQKSTPMIECPHCGAEVFWDDSSVFRPFCSERCKMIDFGQWANEEHSIPEELLYPESHNDPAID
ncbi:MAG: DNA gyrase inhibitor YacG [Pseudomonadota bacterium]|jgi:hypothetical protein|nr:DNA gyrase inhibitor YacG [Pseudomonadota bacterium]